MLSSLKRTISSSRSRIGCLKEGDANINFVHMHAHHRKRKNFIGMLVSDGVVYPSHEDKAKLVEDFYDSLLGTTWVREHSIDLQALGIPTHNLAVLDSHFSEKEVWETIKQKPSDKAPAPDGFTGSFCLDIIKNDVMVAVSAVWSRKFMSFRSLNNAFITLIPKMVGADHVKV
jgi:hypothetical protein